jgi:diacylglycerol kinase (ATP)
MMTTYVILNPYANRWKAGQRKKELEDLLLRKQIEHELVETNATNHAIELAELAARRGHSPIIAAGGDGTIGEVVNGLYRATPDDILGPLGVIPLGTANDLPVNLGLPLEMEEALDVIISGNTRMIDLGMANEWVFDNNSAIGLEPMVTIYNIRMTRLKGVIRYLVAAVRAIMDKPTWEMTIRWDDGEYEGPVSLVSVGNCPITGGLFKMAPAADPADGMLTFVYGYAPTRRKMFSLLPRTINGSYVHDPAIQQHHSSHITISASPATPIQIDGEVRETALTQISYTTLPQKLNIFSP